ncbi:MAG TPA: RsmD family RNA methyltransferase [Chloroflexota bacterium]|nr:RsmD family RNA methyltransferase [Chloroflexota bacterium]
MRVIAGIARGRPLRAPSRAPTRPTADKIKGAIFSMLDAEALRRGFEPQADDDEHDGRFAAAVAWPRVLELYAGSGALAIEALSRGAERADLVESSADARRTIVANLEKTGLTERASVHALSSEAAVSTFRGTYDLILLDPPYDAEGVRLVLERLAGGGLLDRSGVVVWEHSRSTVPPEQIAAPGAEGGLQLLRTRQHGAASVTLYAAAIPRESRD